MENYLLDRLLPAGNSPNRLFLRLEDDTPVTYGDFSKRVNQYANCFSNAGLTAGDRVALQARKSWQALAIYLGAVKAGGVFLPLNNAYTAGEISYFIDNAQPAIFICDPENAAELEPVAQEANAALFTLDNLGQGSITAAADSCSDEFEAVTRQSDDLAAILYTSGTTGRSKGAMLSHHNLFSNAEILVESWQFTKDDVLLHGLPIFHTHGLFVATNTTLLAGSSMIFLPGFDAHKMIEQLPNATCMMGVPTFYTRLLANDGFNKELVSHIRLFVSGSAPLLAETHVEFEQRTGHRILERYGMTETNMNTSNPFLGDRRPGTVGPALPGVEVRIVATDNKAPVPAGEIGSVEVKGPNVFSGYWQMPEKTAEEFTADGFFITGDLGFLSNDRYLTIVGRDKDLIISGGFNIYPKEIELLLDELSGVGESAVIGISHPDFGEGVVAVLTGNSPPNEGEVKDLLADKLARFKQPKKVFVIDELPRNTMGKVQKNILREQFAGCFDS